ncbi:MAG: 3-hydroxyacyl-CoA dehydrogenase [Gemmataceae bacterium]
MGGAWTLQVEGGVATLTIAQPGSRANVLSREVLEELEQRVAELERLADLQGLILRSGKPGMFVAGADLRELASKHATKEAVGALIERGQTLMDRLERLPYPTVAAIEGPCLGGGLELALGFDYRLASTHPKTELGLPETKVGLIPGWGGTQRLPRVIGVALATELIAAGESLSARRAAEVGLVFDAVPPDKLLDEAHRLLLMARQNDDWQKERERKRQPVGMSEDEHRFLFAAARAQVQAKTRGHVPAPMAAVEVIARTCNRPLEQGLKIERDAFLQVVGSEISRNLIAVFFMNQRLQKDPGVADTAVQPREVRQVGVLGAGIMGSGIAGAFVRRGLPVLMLDLGPAQLEKGLSQVWQMLKGRLEAGRLSADEAAAAMGRLGTTTTLHAMYDRDLIVEAVVEDEPTKIEVFRELERIVGPDTLIASNTSTISITRMARALKHPQRFAGMHFFNPVDRMPLVEVIRGERTDDQVVVTLVAVAKRLGKTPIVVRDGPGFLVNRVLFPYLNEALLMLEEGASPRELDRAATAFGMPMGPITLQDVVGLDTSLYAGRVLQAAYPDRSVSIRILELLVGAGRLGQKTGAGFYRYTCDPKKGEDDPELERFVAQCGRPRRSFTQEEITDRLFLPMLVEATRCVGEGIVREPADVDMGLILGIGFPAWRGGILRWCDSLGADRVLAKLERYAPLGKRFEPTEQLHDLARSGGRWYPDS